MKHLLTEEQLLFNIVKCLRENQKRELSTIIEELQPYDIANVYEGIPQKFKSRFLLFLNNNLLADVIQEVEDTNLQYDILNKLPPEKKADILDLMDNDDLAHLLHELPEEKAEALLSVMKHEESTIVQNIMTFPAETAGRLMTNRFVWIKDYYTVREAIDKLKNFASYAETISYLYVIDENRKLVGVVSYRDLLLAELDQKIKDIMFTRVIYVS